MSKYDLGEEAAVVLDCAMGVLRSLAKATKSRHVSAFVHEDGTVSIYGSDKYITTWTAKAHLDPDGGGSLPSDAVARALLWFSDGDQRT